MIQIWEIQRQLRFCVNFEPAGGLKMQVVPHAKLTRAAAFRIMLNSLHHRLDIGRMGVHALQRSMLKIS